MGTTFTKDDGTVGRLLERVKRDYHGELVEAEATVEILLASNGEQPPLTKGGWPAAALAKVNSLKDRAAGLADCRVSIDSDWWERHDDDERLALLDHELQHFEPVRGKVGQIKTDDLGRPRLRLRLHDFELGGFESVARRHGAAATEVQAVAKVWRRLSQLEIDWPAAETAAAGAELATA